MQRSDLVVPWALAVTFALASCTSGQSGHEGGGLDGPGNVRDGGDEGGAGGASGASGASAGAGGFGNDGPGDEDGGPGCVPSSGDQDMPVTGDVAVDQDAGAPTDAGSDCLSDDADPDGAVPPPRDPTPLNSEHVCASSLIEAPIDCFDVCGALTTCDAAIACDSCLERCAASQATRQRVRCLSLAIYWIDEDGCERMVQEYHAFTDAFVCD